MKLKLFLLTAICMCVCTLMQAQNIEARELNIYFGNPKSVTISSQQGNQIVEFDRQGRVTSIQMGPVRLENEWAADGSKIEVSQYMNDDFVNADEITILKTDGNTLKYKLGQEIDKVYMFKANGAIESMTTANSADSMTIKYVYEEPDDYFPIKTEMTANNQSATIQIDIEEVDDKGNPKVYSEQLFGMKNMTRYEIEYY